MTPVYFMVLLTEPGRIIAVMLGRLRMSIADCRKAYKQLSKQAFTPLHSKANILARVSGFWNVSGGTFDERELEKAIKSVVASSLKHGDPDPDPDPDRALLQETEHANGPGKPCKV